MEYSNLLPRFEGYSFHVGLCLFESARSRRELIRELHEQVPPGKIATAFVGLQNSGKSWNGSQGSAPYML
jgi:hypothetical protein